MNWLSSTVMPRPIRTALLRPFPARDGAFRHLLFVARPLGGPDRTRQPMIERIRYPPLGWPEIGPAGFMRHPGTPGTARLSVLASISVPTWKTW